jgi:DNA repair protein RecO (recombination protein O)
MIESATGLVLRTRPLTETSLIIHWLTPTLGRLATVAKGARRPKSPFRGKLDLFYLADFSFTRSRRSDLHNLREVSLKETHPRLREDLGRVHQASYCAALLEQSTEAETPLPGLFELMRSLLRHVSSESPKAQTIFAFELKLLEQLGLLPNLDQSRLTPGARELSRKLLTADWALAGRLKLAAPQVEELRHFLHGFLVFNLGKIPSGRTAALQE